MVFVPRIWGVSCVPFHTIGELILTMGCGAWGGPFSSHPVYMLSSQPVIYYRREASRRSRGGVGMRKTEQTVLVILCLFWFSCIGAATRMRAANHLVWTRMRRK
jgi:hypothetical protein